MERSALCNELIPISNWGLEANFQKDAKSLYHSYGVYLNANGTDLKDEIQFHSADNLFILNAMKWNLPRLITAERARRTISLSWDASRGAGCRVCHQPCGLGNGQSL